MKIANLFLAAAALTALAAAPALAHDFWAGVETAEAGRPLVVKIGFGHNFPAGEELTAEAMERYEPLKVLGPDGEVKLAPGAAPRLAVTEKPATPGTYLVLAASKEGFFSRGPNGSQRRPKNEVPGAESCSFGSSHGKAVVNLGGSNSGGPDGAGLIARPVGQTLEIVPLADPAGLKTGQKLPVQVWLKGRPLPQARLEAIFAGQGEESPPSFSGLADQEGKLEIEFDRGGLWLIKTSYGVPYADQAVCDQERYNATLTLSTRPL